MFDDNFENDPIFEWVRDEPEVSDFEKKDDVVLVNSKTTNIFSNNILKKNIN